MVSSYECDAGADKLKAGAGLVRSREHLPAFGAMPIRPALRTRYPRNWPEISASVRFARAGGLCQNCKRPHLATVRCLPDGRWFDPVRRTWRNARGRAARWPDLIDATRMRTTRVVLAAAHLDHDPANNRMRNLRGLCQRGARPLASRHAKAVACPRPVVALIPALRGRVRHRAPRLPARHASHYSRAATKGG